MAGDILLCDGCRDNYYNQQGKAGSINGEGCSSLKGASVGEYYLLHWWTQPAVPGAFHGPRRLNSCWHAPGQWAKSKPADVPPFARDHEGKHPVTGKEPRD